jgi:pilus assembly protein CpaB
MDRRFLTVLGVSLVFALVVSSVFYQMTAHSSNAPKPDQTNQKDLVVTTRPLGVGVLVKPADVKVVKISPDGFPKGAFGKVEDVLDRPVISNILLEEPVLEGRLAVKGSGLGLAPTIPVGMRAVSVRVNDVAGVAGFVLPGMHVDVLVTGHPPTGDGGDMTSTCLQNILVLSAGQAIQPDARGGAMQAPTVTLLATPEQAETLTLAGADGRIQLVLRNSSDPGIEKTQGRVLAELYNQRRPEPKPVAAPRPRPVPVVAQAAPPPAAPVIAPPAPDTVVVIRGTTRTVETIPHSGSKN